MSSDALIQITAVKHAYLTNSGPLPVLDGLNVSVAQGAFTAVVGPSGCGKSTLTRLIAGLLFPDEGDVILHNKKVTSPRNTVGMAFQNPVLLEWRSVLNNVLLPLEIVPNDLSRKQKEERGYELLAMVGLEGFEDKSPSELSGGMRRKLSTAIALCGGSRFVTLDELSSSPRAVLQRIADAVARSPLHFVTRSVVSLFDRQAVKAAPALAFTTKLPLGLARGEGQAHAPRRARTRRCAIGTRRRRSAP